MWIYILIVCLNNKVFGHVDNCIISKDDKIFTSEKECNEYMDKKYYSFSGCIKVKKMGNK